MLTFYFIRHGQKEAVPFDPPLTKIGVKQAELTAGYLKTIPFKAIVASQKTRVQQTTQIIAKQLKLSISVDERLQERLEWENDVSFEKFMEEWNKTDIDRTYQPKRGKSSSDNGKQMKEIIDEMSNTYKEGNVLVVTHGGSIGDLLRCLFTEEAITYKLSRCREQSILIFLNVRLQLFKKAKTIINYLN